MASCTYTGRDGTGTLKTWQTDATYGPDGLRRIAKVTDITNGSTWLSTTLSVLDGQSVVQEVVDKPGTSNDETVTYLTGAVGPTYRRGGNGVKTWFAYDGLGSVLGEVSSSTGNLTKSRVYDVYGTVRAEDAATSASNRKFVGALGHPSEGETGLIYMRARYMDPSTGRFVSEDPAGDGQNWFVYCNNDPANKADASG
jgi:RHS repeat-associated protein